MRTIAIAAALAMGLAVPSLATAQGSRPPGASTQAPAAPVGHRQPTARDRPSDQPPPRVELSKEDRALDKALKGICRGC